MWNILYSLPVRQELALDDPLSSVHLVSLDHAVGAAFATRQLAHLGATAVKVEHSRRGDFARGYDAAVRGLSRFLAWLNSGKRRLALVTKSRGADGVPARLLDRADVLAHNLRSGGARRQALQPDELTASRERLIAISLSGYRDPSPTRTARPMTRSSRRRPGCSQSPGRRRVREGERLRRGHRRGDVGLQGRVDGSLRGRAHRQRRGTRQSNARRAGRVIGGARAPGASERRAAQCPGAHHAPSRRPSRKRQRMCSRLPRGQNDDEWTRLCCGVSSGPTSSGTSGSRTTSVVCATGGDKRGARLRTRRTSVGSTDGTPLRALPARRSCR